MAIDADIAKICEPANQIGTAGRAAPVIGEQASASMRRLKRTLMGVAHEHFWIQRLVNTRERNAGLAGASLRFI